MMGYLLGMKPVMKDLFKEDVIQIAEEIRLVGIVNLYQAMGLLFVKRYVGI